jgi:2'-5' RNA ligase
MIITLSLWFDEESEQILTDARKALAIRDIVPNIQGSARPHITLGQWDASSAESVINQTLVILKETLKFNLVFDAVGNFSGNPSTTFLLPKVTQELLAIHSKVHTSLEKIGKNISPYYLADNWTPHCTMAFQVPVKKMLEATEFLLPHFKFPMNVTVKYIGLIDETNHLEIKKISLL